MSGIIEAYNDGYLARNNSVFIKDNLFQPNEREFKSWRTGWFDADHDILYTSNRGQDEKL